MSNVILDTPFITYKYFEDSGLFVIDYKASTERMSVDEYKAFVTELKDLTIEHKPQFLIDNSINRLYIVDPEMQEWTVSELAPAWIGFGLKKYVQVLAKDLVANLSGQQTVEAAKSIPGMFEVKFFENTEDALAWFGITANLSS